jgi:hypothetical protein
MQSKSNQKKAEEKSQRAYFALQEKMDEIISYSSKLHRFRS